MIIVCGLGGWVLIRLHELYCLVRPHSYAFMSQIFLKQHTHAPTHTHRCSFFSNACANRFPKLGVLHYLPMHIRWLTHDLGASLEYRMICIDG